MTTGIVTACGPAVLHRGAVVPLPATGQPLAEWVANLEREGEMTNSADRLAAILDGIAGDRCVMTVQVVSVDAGRQYTLNSYRADGVETALPYAERVAFTPDDLTAACRACGWGMPGAPAKMPGLNHRYILKRGAEMTHTAAEKPWQDVERKQREARMTELAALDAGENGDILRSLPREVQESIYRNAGMSR